MVMKEVLETYNDMVSFPLTVTKIRKAGFAVRPYLCSLAEALRECEDSNILTVKGLLMLTELLEVGNGQAENFRIELN